jgi:hypothetical protein
MGVDDQAHHLVREDHEQETITLRGLEALGDRDVQRAQSTTFELFSGSNASLQRSRTQRLRQEPAIGETALGIVFDQRPRLVVEDVNRVSGRTRD